MSEQATHQAAQEAAAPKLENQYKPVGIAAIRAAALCKNASAEKQDKR